MKRRAIPFVLTAGWLLSAGALQAATVSIYCGDVGKERELCQQGVELWSKKTGHTVKVISKPNASNDALTVAQQMLASGSGDIDVIQIDVVWPGILAQHLQDLTPYAKDAAAAHFPSIVKNNTVNGKLLAMPWFTDAGLLYYRKDLLEKYQAGVPKSWEELADIAARIQAAEQKAGNTKMVGFIWQGRAYEGLTCNALEWVASYGGGSVVEANGKPSINNPNTVAALKQAASWIGKITPKGVLNSAEEEARGTFQSGNAVFMRNWPYAWALAQSGDSSIKGKVGVAPLPKGGANGKSAATLGGWQLAVSKYSKNPAIAADLVMFLVSPQEQKRRAISGAFNPTLPKLYTDAEVLKANPFMGELQSVFQAAVARPSTVTSSRYNQVSNEFYNAVHAVLSGTATPDNAVKDLEQRLKRLAPGGKW
ncbi:ABC transporter substrate-binding protein [Chitinivorax sp. B]|uniref:ABC transporter substrate-binding protein n=1 Tax=Chitinivorax sp. B TaxID=2502235 RepID=UPI0010FA2860|nr:ABC transporter substrate-binding protein [Chitinivorax sp. B]